MVRLVHELLMEVILTMARTKQASLFHGLNHVHQQRIGDSNMLFMLFQELLTIERIQNRGVFLVFLVGFLNAYDSRNGNIDAFFTAHQEICDDVTCFCISGRDVTRKFQEKLFVI